MKHDNYAEKPSTFNAAIDYLYSLQKYGVKLGLNKTEQILALLGNPHRDFPCIHVAGTNGKGSTSAMISSILMAHGYKVGLFTSPHLVSFTERIRINNEQISEADVVNLTEEIKERILEQQSSRTAGQEDATALLRYCATAPTFFEFVTAMAFLYFARNNLDWAVIEVGMGGRLDATNVIMPEVSVITRISYDHKEFLGDTLTEIAGEKAGIIKKGVPVVSALQEKEAEGVITAAAKERSSSLYIYGRDFHGTLKSSGLEGITFDYHDSELITLTLNQVQGELSNLFVPLPGDHQICNASVAIKAAMIALKYSNKGQVTSNKLKENNSTNSSLVTRYSLLKQGLANTKWHGRLEIVSKDPFIMIDGAHNPDAARALSDFIKSHLMDYRITLIMGVMSDKDIEGILRPLLPLASDIIFTAPDYGRASSPEKLAEYASAMGFSSRMASSVKEAIKMAIKCCETETRRLGDTEKKRSNDVTDSPIYRFTDSIILITGSFYTIGEAKEILGEKAILGNLRERV